jgi:hypothetical protein
MKTTELSPVFTVGLQKVSAALNVVFTMLHLTIKCRSLSTWAEEIFHWVIKGQASWSIAKR